ncbi:MAG: 2,3-bisphosphoglycerate-dependent phosphoglycerate mutase [Zhongshania marina]|jgi:broad specificity phosphatase PhoE
MPRLIAALVRHGEYHQRAHIPSALQPYPLNARGFVQADEAAAALIAEAAQNQWDICNRIDSSTLLRAWQTAERYCLAIQGYLDKPAQLASFDALCERSVGSAANLTLAEIQKIISDDPRFADLPEDWKSNSHFCLPLAGAESLMMAGQRVAEHISMSMQDCINAERDTLKVFVGHGAAFRHAAHILGVLNFDDIAKFSMYHAKPIYIELIDDKWVHIGGDWKLRDGARTMLD